MCIFKREVRNIIRKIFKFLFSRIAIVGFFLCLQIGFFILLMVKFASYSQCVTMGLTVISLVVVSYIVNRNDSPEFKLAWCVPILLFPIFGGLFYLFIKLQAHQERKKLKAGRTAKALLPHLTQDEDVIDELFSINPHAARQASYATDYAGYCVYKNSSVKYLPIGEVYFEHLVKELEKAEEFIFMEYFIIARGRMWDVVFKLLEEKAKKGVDVRLIYDSMGSLFLVPSGYDKFLEGKGIKCIEFNKFRPAMSSNQNNRDHRKICVIDGRVAFTGGINIADEYINELDRCGHWKDNGVKVTGDAVKSFTLTFLQTWNSFYPIVDDRCYLEKTYSVKTDGFVMPYADIPGDDERVCESVYLNLISRANTYLYITTPYFILGEEFITALELAAKGGVDVRIVTPHKWDKWFVHMTTRSYYERLIKAGIQVYEYTPGFIHAKTFVCDGKIATVGTANLDYRSLYLQYECGLWMYDTACIEKIKDDLLDTMSKSHLVTLEECKNQRLGVRVIQKILHPLAPLM